MERHDGAHHQGANQGRIEKRRHRAVVARQLARGDLQKGKGACRGERQQQGRLHHFRARADNDKRAHETDDHAGPAARADILAEDRHGQGRHDDRAQVEQGAGIGQRHGAQRHVKQHRRDQQKRRAPQLKAIAPRPRGPWQLPGQQRHDEKHAEGHACPHHLLEGIGNAHQVLGNAVLTDEQHHREQDPQHAAPAVGGARWHGFRRRHRPHPCPLGAAERRPACSR